MMIWTLIQKFMVDTEYANNIKFTQTAWDRALQLEKDINAYIWDHIENPHRLEMVRAREDADRVGAARIAFEDEQTKRIEELNLAIRAALAALPVMIVNRSPDWNQVDKAKAILHDVLERQNTNGTE